MSIAVNNLNGKIISTQYLGFSGGERHIQISPDNDDRTYRIRADLHSSDDIFDFLLTINALNQQNKGGALFDVEIPYLPYSRQDRVCAPGQAFSLQVLAEVLCSFSPDASKRMAITTWDCHSPVGLSLLGAKNIPSYELIKHSNELSALIRSSKSVLVSPDKGAIERTKQVAKAFGQKIIVQTNKVRDPQSGKIIRTDVDVDDLTGKTAIIIDDICDGGMTFIKLAEQLKQRNANRIVLYVTHGIFSKGLDVFDGLIDKIFTTNSFTQPSNTRVNVIAINNKGESS